MFCLVVEYGAVMDKGAESQVEEMASLLLWNLPGGHVVDVSCVVDISPHFTLHFHSSLPLLLLHTPQHNYSCFQNDRS